MSTNILRISRVSLDVLIEKIREQLKLKIGKILGYYDNQQTTSRL